VKKSSPTPSEPSINYWRCLYWKNERRRVAGKERDGKSILKLGLEEFNKEVKKKGQKRKRHGGRKTASKIRGKKNSWGFGLKPKIGSLLRTRGKNIQI